VTGQYTRTFSLGTLNCMDVLYYPPPLASGNITHPCNSRYLGILMAYAFMVSNTTFNNISVIMWRSVLLAEETGGSGENHRPVACH